MFEDTISTIKLPMKQLGVEPRQFRHRSMLHGASHVNRVIIHTLILCSLMEWNHIVPECWAAAYIHDLERVHDGLCYNHGSWAADKKLDEYWDMFETAGVRRENYDLIHEAVTLHSQRNGENPNNLICQVLKDADGLDRVRLGDLDPRYLRLPITEAMIPFAYNLYEYTHRTTDFTSIWMQGKRLWKYLPQSNCQPTQSSS